MSNVLNKVAYHFTGPKLRDGTPLPAIGHKLIFKGKPILCEQGLHFSLHPFDALQYAPGPLLHKVHYGGTVVMGNDKGVCTERTILASIDATDMLRKFTCDEVLRVLPKNAPDIVHRYLITRDESLRGAARDATWGAAWDAARGAVWGAVWGAAWGATRAAARAAWGAAEKRQRNTFLSIVEYGFGKASNNSIPV